MKKSSPATTNSGVSRSRIEFLFLNIGHFLDHFMVLIFATAAALRLTLEWNISYAALIPYATPGFVAFAVCSIPAGWLADRWSRERMMVIFFVGIGASSLLAGLADNPVEIAISLVLVGVFAAIYHPVGLAMVVHGREKTGIPLAVNGIFGNMGVACAALFTGFLIDASGWRAAFIAPGIASILIGIAYWVFMRGDTNELQTANTVESTNSDTAAIPKQVLVQVFAIIFFTTAVGSLVFQSTTFALPKVFEERLTDIADSATLVGWYTFLVFSVAAFAQLVVGYLVDRVSLRAVFATVAALQALFFAIMGQLNGIAALLVAVAFMLVVFGQVPINDVLVGRMTKSEWRSRAFAARSIIAFMVMAIVVPLIAWIHATWGFAMLFRVLAGAAALIFLAVLLLPKSDHRRIQSTA